MKSIEGNLVHMARAGEFDVVVHGCNCFHTMGAGIAKTIAQVFPEALAADKQTPYGEISKLGEISTTHILRDSHDLVIVNAYTQHQWKGRGIKVSYDAIQSCFQKVAKQYPLLKIGYPKIGAGRAGGDWSIIEPLIVEALQGLDHTLVVYKS